MNRIRGGKRSEQNGRIYRFGRHGKQYGIAHFRSGLSCFSLHADETKAEEILNKGAVWQETVKDLSEKADIIITMVGYPSDVEEIYLGENGILRHAKEGAFVIDMTTSKPSLAKKIAEKAKEKSIHALMHLFPAETSARGTERLPLWPEEKKKRLKHACRFSPLWGKHSVSRAGWQRPAYENVQSDRDCSGNGRSG